MEMSCMKKFLICLIAFLIISPAWASIEQNIINENNIQTRIDSIGTKLLNCNKIPKRIVFVYDKSEKKKLLSTEKTLTNRQIIIYQNLYKTIQSNDELAAVLAREISYAVKSYHGMWGGWIDSLEVSLGAKKFEVFADKLSLLSPCHNRNKVSRRLILGLKTTINSDTGLTYSSVITCSIPKFRVSCQSTN